MENGADSFFTNLPSDSLLFQKGHYPVCQIQGEPLLCPMPHCGILCDGLLQAPFSMDCISSCGQADRRYGDDT
ncbi:MAG: hypothetical protein C0394_08440 [Syntrophus sp. (in: bacteria)]|nr:hypothetical protein [Syntrophus sp. (in: bacteria)]